jgi:hypothetical protein
VLSAPYPQENGVPQGSILSVILFTVAINVMVNAVGPSEAASFYIVDDIAIYYSSWSIVAIEHQLQGTKNHCVMGSGQWIFLLPR